MSESGWKVDWESKCLANLERPAKTPKTFEEAFDIIISELRELIICKQRDYGHENILAFGELGVLVRMNDKVARLRNLWKLHRKPQNESIEDTWRDIANYAIIALMLRRGIFKLPLAESVKEGQDASDLQR